MAGRFDLRPLLHGLSRGLRKRRASGPEYADWRTRVALVAVPVLAGVIAAVTGPLTKADQFIAGVALLIGALIAAFTQLASWRDRLKDRAFKIDGVRLRAIDEAAAHVLVSVVFSVAGTADLIVLANLTDDSCQPVWMDIILRILSFAGAAAFTYVALSLVIVVNLLWDAYSAHDPD